MNKELIAEIESLSYSNIDSFIQFWGNRENLVNAEIEPMQADILFYLNALKHFYSKADEAQKALGWYADEKVYEDNNQNGYEPILDDKGNLARQFLKGNQ